MQSPRHAATHTHPTPAHELPPVQFDIPQSHATRYRELYANGVVQFQRADRARRIGAVARVAFISGRRSQPPV